MSELPNLEHIGEGTFNTPTIWQDNKTLLNANNLGNNSTAIQQLQVYLNSTAVPKINKIIDIINTAAEEGLGAAVKIITWGSEE